MMKELPHTWFSTGLRPSARMLRRRLGDLFSSPRRRGTLPLLCALLCVGLLGSLVACDGEPAGATPPPEATASIPCEIAEGVEVPGSVLEPAVDYVLGEYDRWSHSTGVYGIVDGQEQMLGEPAAYDACRIQSLDMVYHYDGLEGYALDVYRLDYQLHTTTPEKVVLAGAMELDDAGWLIPTYPGCTYLVFDVGGTEPAFLFSTMINDSAPGGELFTETLRSSLVWAGRQEAAQAAAADFLAGEHPDHEVRLDSLVFHREVSAPPGESCGLYQVGYAVETDGAWTSMPQDAPAGEHVYLLLSFAGDTARGKGLFTSLPDTCSRTAEALAWGVVDLDFALRSLDGSWYGLGGSAGGLTTLLGGPETVEVLEGAVSYQPGDRWERRAWGAFFSLECYVSPEGETSIWKLESSRSDLRTARGLSPGTSTREDVLRLYPAASSEPNWDFTGDFLWYGPESGGPGHYLVFYFDGGDTVSRIQLIDYFD